MVRSYSSREGAAFVYTVNIDDTVYQGEATKAKIARAIAATKALVGINVSIRRTYFYHSITNPNCKIDYTFY